MRSVTGHLSLATRDVQQNFDSEIRYQISDITESKIRRPGRAEKGDVRIPDPGVPVIDVHLLHRVFSSAGALNIQESVIRLL